MATLESKPAEAPAYGPPETDERPAPASCNPWRRVWEDFAANAARGCPSRPGRADFDFARTQPMAHDPLPILLSLYERARADLQHPASCTRKVVFMLGPEANHYVTVSHPENFHWREGSFGDLIPLLGDGLLTIDGAYHDRARRIMMPAFHREQIEAAVEAMVAEAERRDRRAGPGRGRRRLRLGSQPGDADRDAGPARARPRRRRPAARRRPSTSSARSASTAPTSTCACCAARARPGGG